MEVKKPLIHPGQILVKVEYFRICGSDVHGYLDGIMMPTESVIGN